MNTDTHGHTHTLNQAWWYVPICPVQYSRSLRHKTPKFKASMPTGHLMDSVKSSGSTHQYQNETNQPKNSPLHFIIKMKIYIIHLYFTSKD